jgi:glutathione S-transferase
MAMQLYDLAGADPARRFSPYCWRTRLALAHKGLAVETVPWRFVDKDAIAFSGQGLVPVLVDGGRTVSDSAVIADYLEATYPDRPSLFGGAAGRSAQRFIAHWTAAVLQAGIAPFVMVDILDVLDEPNRAYFRQSREKRFGMTLEQFQGDRAARLAGFRQSLAPLRLTLGQQPYLGGEAPNYADYTVFGAFLWARAVSPFKLLEPSDPVAAWRGRLLEAFDGLAGRAPGFPL